VTAKAAQVAERAAETARQDLALGLDGPVPDILRQLEDQADFRIFILDLPDGGIEGAYRLDHGHPYVLLNRDRGPQKKRFTLAHEYGHHCLGHGAVLDVEIKLSDRHKKEVEANYFAAAFLMPRAAIDAWFAKHDDPSVDLETVVRLAYFFNVSSYVSCYRLGTVARLSANKKRTIEQELRDEEHYRVAHELGLRWPEDTLQNQSGRYLPARMEARIITLLEKELLSPAAAKARLHLSPAEQGEQELDQLVRAARAGSEDDRFE
jgi:Zn-dependent peptidase ImmA (M78 family)